MKFRIGLAQTCHPAGGDAAALVERVAAQAAGMGVDLLVFPESLMSRFEASKDSFVKEAQEVGGVFTRAVDAVAERFGLWIVYTMNERNPSGGLPYNTALVTGPDGVCRGTYRKVHLFDSAAVRESERMSAGDKLFDPVQTPFGKLGLGICYDLRFPELARSAVQRGCEVMVFPSAWVSGEGKVRQWHTLLAARAVENQMFVVGVSRADEGYVGSSAVFAPDGAALVSGGTEEEFLTCDVDTEDIGRMRSRIPALEHRRPELY